MTTAPRGEPHRLAGGRIRSVQHGRPGRSVSLTLPACTSEQVAWLEAHVGQVVLVRDDRGRKVFGTYATVSVTPFRTEAGLNDASVQLTEVRHSEAV